MTKRLIAVLLTAFLVVVPSLDLSARDSVLSTQSRHTAGGRLVCGASALGFASQALAVPMAIAPLRRILKTWPRPEILQRFRPNPLSIPTNLADDADDEELQNLLANYESEPERLAVQLRDLAENKDGFIVPADSFAPTAIDDRGNVKPSGFLGLVSTPPQSLETAFIARQNEFKMHLRTMVRAEFFKNGNGISEELVDQLYQELLHNFYFIDPGHHHLTFAGIEAGPQFKVKGFAFRRLWNRELTRAREIARFRQEMNFEYDGRVGFLFSRTSSIVALLKPKSTKDLSRFLSVKTNYGNRLPVTELAHATLAYVRGLPEPDPERPGQIRYRVSRMHMQWIEGALRLMEIDRATEIHKSSYENWNVNHLELRASPNIRDQVRVAPVPLLSEDLNRRLIELGKATLSYAWRYVLEGPRDLDGISELSKHRLDHLDVVRGLIPRLNLRNTRAMLAAIGAGALSVVEVMRYIRQEQRLVAMPLMREGRPILRVTAHFDQPGLFFAISRTLDRMAALKRRIYRTDVDAAQDPVNARVAFEIELEKISAPDLLPIARMLSQIPDVGAPVPFWDVVDRAIHIWRRWREGFVLRIIQIDMSLRVRPPRAPSRLTQLLRGIRKLDRRASVLAIELNKGEENITLKMMVEVPQSVAGKLANQLFLVLKEGGNIRITVPSRPVSRHSFKGPRELSRAMKSDA